MKSILRALIRRTLPVKVLQFVKKIHYSRLLRSFSEKDEIDFKVIKYIVNLGDYVVDIGANIGVYTKYLSERVGSLGRVYSIEPIHLRKPS
jgi:23S rRNA U2552 (ribose-2'-O)-methylase RlmE/FtsJ